MMATATVPSTSAGADPAVSRRLMMATYAVGAVGLAVSFWYLGDGDAGASAAWAAVVAVGGSGLLSFVRHSVFHRSDAARMGWDYGRRNNFQIEVGLANLAIGATGIAAWALGWGVHAEGTVVVVFGLYLLGAALLHASELRDSGAEGGGRFGPLLATVAFSAALLWVGVAAVRA
jgi:hypothetical protein